MACSVPPSSSLPADRGERESSQFCHLYAGPVPRHPDCSAPSVTMNVKRDFNGETEKKLQLPGAFVL